VATTKIKLRAFAQESSRDNLIGDDAAAADLAARLASTNGDKKDSSQSFRSRKLSKDILIGDSAVAELVAGRKGETLTPVTALTAPREEPDSHGVSAAPVASRLQVTATAETAAEAARAAAMAGSILFVATEFEGSGDSFASDSPRQSGELKGESIMNSSSSTLAALGDHGKIVGQFSCHGAEPGDEGATAKINQDCACVASPIGDDPTASLFCVYDGHGKCGTEVSMQVLQSIHYELDKRCATELRADPEATLIHAFHSVQAQLQACAAQEELLVDARDSGACAVVAYLHERMLWVAGAGDCTAVVGVQNDKGGARAVTLSTDHKADRASEKARIVASGGGVRDAIYIEGQLYAPARLFEDINKPRLGPGLAISRSIGDLNAMRAGLIATPDVQHRELADGDSFLILASDGVWEFIEPQAAVDIVEPYFRKGKRAFDACKMLIAKAAIQWQQNEGSYRDDITAIVVWLPQMIKGLESRRGSSGNKVL